ncbi:hypothetical protein SAMN04488589_1033 [Methanolobus vulcani]|uniref:Uncharacterized protein n=1 Tax=Methanolobus vulcani TaxID=38026 RepID=A0A7Z7FE07_9EURY|nr:hypothetical protein [Methanolobus vulcani]MDK2825378.1 hypothetical protein [Methanolobus sp.]MDK2948503.1 hypothetical protein [Methanolobus sp.]SDF65730.1 hypothetical protein SAMN04488589_1033 [Methanolobus vulcani]
MPSISSENIEEVLVSPLSTILGEMGKSIAQTQRALDRNSIDTQIELSSDEVLKDYNLEATWYHIPEVDIELKMTLSMSYEEEKDSKGRVRGYKRILNAAPLNASYKSLNSYDVEGSSVLKAKIVSVPPSYRVTED